MCLEEYGGIKNKMRKLFGIVYIICCFNTNAGAQFGASAFSIEKVSSFKLVNVKGKAETLRSELGNNRLTAFIFLSPECPLCRNYTKVLNELEKEYPTSLGVVGVISGSAYPTKEVRSFKDKFSIVYPLYIDPKKELTEYLEARITPEVVLIDNKGSLVYRGAIDDWVISLGKTKIKSREYYLRDAINSYLENKPAAVPYKEPKGCYINEY
jgi:thiol-disulfide isomerase/thioredoxin